MQLLEHSYCGSILPVLVSTLLVGMFGACSQPEGRYAKSGDSPWCIADERDLTLTCSSLSEQHCQRAVLRSDRPDPVNQTCVPNPQR